MCGVGALFSNSRIENASIILKHMNQSMRHRGPDGNGVWLEPNQKAGLAHTRLSIIDLTDASSQPFTSSDQRFTISYNGEIYNYKELREECSTLGSIFVTNGDAEVAIECYRHFGAEASNKFRGMWALVIIDHISRVTFISRDPFGIKPLFYAEKNNILIFASEIKVFHKLDSDFLNVDQMTIDLFKNHKIYDRGNWTFFKHIKKFPSAHHYSFPLDQVPNALNIRPTIYYNLIKNKHRRLEYDETKLTNNLRSIFKESIKLHMRSDVPIGFCLSGGLDSSAIVSTARQLFPSSQLKTFTTRFDNHKRIDETEWAKRVADHVNATPTYTSPQASKFLNDFPQLIETQDEPFGSASIYSQYCIFKEIQDSGVKVVLDGQGADELFAGYYSYFPNYIQYLLREGKYLDTLIALYKLKRNYYAGIKIYRKILSKIINNLKGKLRIPLPSKKIPSYTENSFFYTAVGTTDTLEKRLKFARKKPKDFNEFLLFMALEGNVPMLLRFEDRNSMAFSIESRVPFLIHEILAYSLRVPPQIKMKNGITKYILRAAMREIVPDSVLNRMDKLGFPAPDKEWMKDLLNHNVSRPFSEEWINFVLASWESMLEKRRPLALNIMK